MATFLLEIGSEEIPARFLKGQEEAAVSLFTERLAEAGISFGSIRAMSTPRRLAVIVADISPRQEARDETVMGPPARVAYDADGRPTRALEGFCRANGAAPEDVFVVKTPKGEYAALKVASGGAPVVDILARICPQIIAALPFAKKMRWGGGAFSYARPLRWLVALLDKDVVPFEVAGLCAGRKTAGLRAGGEAPCEVPDAASYPNVIADSCGVELDTAKRRSRVISGGNALAEARNCGIIWNESLLAEVCGLVEAPVPLLGAFDPAYLEVPEEVLLTSMQTHQKSFGLRGADGRLAPYFLTVLNGAPADAEVVRGGWQRVLKARLEDARFFWETDKKDTLANWQAKLEHVIFIGQLGSMADKARRLAELCVWIGQRAGVGDAELARRAGLLAKADLVSGMVGEFDSLQGIMGGIYARKFGEPEAVAQAIAEQYLPQGPDSPLPETPLGLVLALADKTDTLTGCFGLKMIPTGAADPNGLRRCALGIIRILLDMDAGLLLPQLFAASLKTYGEQKWKMPAAEIMEKLMEFMAARMRNFFIAQGFGTLTVDAALAAGCDNPGDVLARLKALESFAGSPAYAASAQVLKRVENMLKKPGRENIHPDWDDSLLAEAAEKDLSLLLRKALPGLDAALAAGDYGAALAWLENLAAPIDAFFAQIMVLCEDAALRANRLAMLAAIGARYARIGKFSLLQG